MSDRQRLHTFFFHGKYPYNFQTKSISNFLNTTPQTASSVTQVVHIQGKEHNVYYAIITWL